MRPETSPQTFGWMVAWTLAAVLAGGIGRAEENQLFGVLVLVDAERQSIAVRDPRTGRIFVASITDDTIVQEGDEIVELEQATVGAPVILQYAIVGETRVASRIILRRDLIKDPKETE